MASLWTSRRMVSTRTFWARWARNSTRIKTLTSASRYPRVTESSGTKLLCVLRASLTLRSTVRAYVKVPSSTASATWTNRSRAKVRRTRGEYWVLASWSVTTVSEKVSDVTVMSDVAMADSTVRAASWPPLNR